MNMNSVFFFFISTLKTGTNGTNAYGMKSPTIFYTIRITHLSFEPEHHEQHGEPDATHRGENEISFHS